MLYRINLKLATRRIELQNEILPALQARFEEAEARGVVLELTPSDISWIDSQLELEA